MGFNNSRTATDNPFNSYSPTLQSSFKATATQHLLQGFGIFINKRFMYQAQNNRKITDSSFRQQILYTVNQVENIYWGLVSAYEDVQAKERALTQSTQLESDTRKQLDIGTMAPLDVVNAQSTVATDKQALISSQNNLQYRAAHHQAGHCAQPQRTRAGCRAHHSHRSHQPRRTAGRKAARG